MSVNVKKTYKLFLGGKFVRSESGRSFGPGGANGRNAPRASRKDLRDAVVAARKALPSWAGMTAYNRGQIIYRMAEILATRSRSMVDELRVGTGRRTADQCKREVETAGELLTFYAGLPDKLQQLLGSQNEVAGPFFNFSTVEPLGVVGAVAPDAPGLLGTLALAVPLIAGGNTVVLLTSETAPWPALALGELLAVSDLPGGVINLLSGYREELTPHLAAHRDVGGLLVSGPPDAALSAAAADSVKRVRYAEFSQQKWSRTDTLCSLHMVQPFVETKTLWHPVAP